MTVNETREPTPPGLHPRLTVVLVAGAPGDGGTIAAHLAGDDGPIDAGALAAAAEQRATADRDLRLRDHQDTLAQLGRERDAAADERDAVAAEAAQVVARHARVLDGSRWCDNEGTAMQSMAAALNDAEETLAAARETATRAAARLEQVTEQRAVAKTVLEEARAELADLESANLAEPALRRELEQAVNTVRDLTAAIDSATVRRDQAETSRFEAAEALAQVATDLAALPDVDPTDVDALRHALDDATSALNGPPDAAALALADAIEATEDELAQSGATPADLPPLGAAEEAFDRLATAEAALAAAKAEAAGARSGPPDWWHRLHALHTAVVETESEASGRRRSTRERYETAVAAERALLDELGFDSYVDALLSGGRLPNQAPPSASGIAAAETAVATARADLDAAREDERRSAPLRDLLDARERLARDAAALVDADPSSDLVLLLREHRVLPEVTLRALVKALAPFGEPTASGSPIHVAEHFLARYEATADPDRAAALEESRDTLEADESRWAAESLAAAEEIERLADSENDARRAVTRLEAELQSRAHGDGDPVHRAASAAALHDRISNLEAQLVRAREDAETGVAETAAEVETATEHRDRARQQLLTLARHAARLAEDIVPERRPAFDALTNVGALAGALRAEAEILGGQIVAAQAELALTSELLDAAVSTYEGARAVPAAGQPTPDDSVTALADLLADDERHGPVVVVEPLTDDDPALAARLLDTILRASADRPVVLLTTDHETLAWAIELPVEDGAVVPLRALVPDDRPLTSAES